MSVRISGHSAPKSIVAAIPHVVISVKNGDRISIRPNEPVYMFLEGSPKAVRSVRSLAQNSRFIVTPSDLPPFHSPPRTPGTWVKISVKPNTKGGSEQFVLESQPTTGRALGHTEATFTIIALAKVLR